MSICLTCAGSGEVLRQERSYYSGDSQPSYFASCTSCNGKGLERIRIPLVQKKIDKGALIQKIIEKMDAFNQKLRKKKTK